MHIYNNINNNKIISKYYKFDRIRIFLNLYLFTYNFLLSMSLFHSKKVLINLENIKYFLLT